MFRRVLVALAISMCIVGISRADTLPAPGAICLTVVDLPNFAHWNYSGGSNGSAWEAQFQWIQGGSKSAVSNGAGNFVQVVVSPFTTIDKARTFYDEQIFTKNIWKPAGIGDKDEGGHGSLNYSLSYELRFIRRNVVVSLTVSGPSKNTGLKSGINPTVVANFARLMDHRIERLTK